MKKFYMIIAALIAVFNSNAQITINSADLMMAGDTFRISIGDTSQTIDFTTTGPNTTWDYSNLIPVTQHLDSFFSVGSLGSFNYSFIFNNSILYPDNVSNVVERSNALGGLPPLPISITDIFNFYNNGSTSLKQTGIGATITGIQTPIAFTSKDFIYNFPMMFNDMDSCDAAGNLPAAGIGYYGFTRHRVNKVDGWGTITTPYGTFNALRVKTIINQFDSLYVDSLMQGFAIQQPEETDYKWLANGQGVPVLEIRTSNILSVQVVTEVRFRDSVRSVGIEELAAASAFTISPNPANENTVASFNLSKPSKVTLTLYAADGRKIKVIENKQLGTGVHKYFLKPEFSKAVNGIYFLELNVDGAKSYRKIVFAN